MTCVSYDLNIKKQYQRKEELFKTSSTLISLVKTQMFEEFDKLMEEKYSIKKDFIIIFDFITYVKCMIYF